MDPGWGVTYGSRGVAGVSGSCTAHGVLRDLPLPSGGLGPTTGSVPGFGLGSYFHSLSTVGPRPPFRSHRLGLSVSLCPDGPSTLSGSGTHRRSSSTRVSFYNFQSGIVRPVPGPSSPRSGDGPTLEKGLGCRDDGEPHRRLGATFRSLWVDHS